MYPLFTHWLPLIAYCLAIFIQSAQPLPTELPAFPLMDKVMHLGGYALLGMLFYRALRTCSWAADERKLVVAAILATGLYGVSDELHQAFVPERVADVLDALADLLGGALGVLVYHWGQPWLGRRTKPAATLTSQAGSDNNP